MITTNSRNFFPDYRKPDDLVRVRCIGDSITYGGGVAPYETLPAHLEEQLNKAFPLVPVEVVNNGLVSGNIWNSWTNICDPNGPHDCSAYIFQLCANDAKILNTHGMRHPEELVETWDGTEADIRAVLEPTFDDIAAFSARTSIPVIIVFYAQSDRFLDIAEIVGLFCKARTIPFFNVAALFDRSGLLDNDQVFATQYDMHPAGQAHRLVAGRLAGDIKRHRLIPSLSAHTADGPVDAAVLAAIKAAIAAGAAPEAMMSWGLKTLRAKKPTLRRLAEMQGTADLEGGLQGDLQGDLEGAIAALETAWARWVTWQTGLATAHALEHSSDDLYSRLDDYSGLLKRYREGLAVTQCLPDPSVGRRLGARLPQGPLWKEPVEPNLSDFMETRLRSAAASLRRIGDPISSTRAALKALAAAPDDFIGRAGAEAAADTLAPFDHYFTDAVRELDVLLPATQDCLERQDLATLTHTTEEPLAGAIAAMTHRLSARAKGFAHRYKGAYPAPVPKIGPWTVIDIQFANDTPDLENFLSVVWMRCAYEAPHRWPIKQTHTIRFDRPRWTSRFAVPVMFRGRVEFGFHKAERVAAFGTHFVDMTVTWLGFDGTPVERATYPIAEKRQLSTVCFHAIMPGVDAARSDITFGAPADFVDVH